MVVILLLVLLVILFFSIGLYLISRHKQQAIQVFTLESFMNTTLLSKQESQKKSIIDTINDYFDDDDQDGILNKFNSGESEDEGDDGGE